MPKMKTEHCYKLSFISLVVLPFLCYILSYVWSFRVDTTNIGAVVNPNAARKLMIKSREINGDYQLVSNRNRTYVYSAYLEERSKKIRVIGITHNATTSLFCVFWYMNNTNAVNSRLVTGYVVKITEAHYRRYTATHILCYLLENEVPDAVSIVENIDEVEPSNILPVQRIENGKKKHNFTLCVSPIHQRYDDTKELIEWLEIIQLQGITNVLVYVNNVSNDVISVLKHYQGNGVVRMFPWTLPSVFCNQTLKEMHYCGQLVASSDCIYRSKGQSHFITSFDLDELIVPQNSDDYTWMDMMNRLPKESVYLFRNNFFFPSTNTNKATRNTVGNLRIMTHQLRDDFIHGAKDRSKWIAHSEQVATMGIHNAWSIKSGDEYTVPIDIGLLHHYRKKSVVYPKDVYITREIHKAAEKYHKQLQSRVANAYNELKIKNIEVIKTDRRHRPR